MAENDTAKPMDDADVTTPPATTEFEPAPPLKDAGVAFEPDSGGEYDAESRSETAATPVIPAVSQGSVASATDAVRENAGGLQQQAGDRMRMFAETGKEKVGGVLDQFAQMLTDAATQVDDKLGGQYGEYARSAASSVQGFAQSVRDKDVDEFAEDVRGYIRQSPAAAVGVAAALGFALARVVHAGLDQRA